MKYSKPEIDMFFSATRMIERTVKDDLFYIDCYVYLLSIFAYEADE